MIGLALEGGGAKGAFHMGAVRALMEEGIRFGGVAGTSIGAFNGAIIAQGDFEKGYTLWENIDLSIFFDLEAGQIETLLGKTLNKESLGILKGLVKDIIDNRGVNTIKIREMLEKNIDEAKLRESSVDFGLVTVSVTDLKPLELYKEDIPEGLMTAYIMASANFPAFRLEPIEGKLYVDGGFYDNCPINLLLRKGYRKIYAIRTLGIGLNQPVIDPEAEIWNIYPSEDLGRVLDFNQELIQRNLKLGYFDTMRILRDLKGSRYYLLNEFDEADVLEKLCNLAPEKIQYINEPLGLRGSASLRTLMEKTLPKLAEGVGTPEGTGYAELMLDLLEEVAWEMQVERLNFYSVQELFRETLGTEPGRLFTESEASRELPVIGGRFKAVQPVLTSIVKKIEKLPVLSKENGVLKAAARLLSLLEI